MTYYMDTIAFAYNEPSQTLFYCMECAKKEWGGEPHTHNGVMMVNEHTEMSYLQCDECGTVLIDD